jgi:hypothetical protein
VLASGSSKQRHQVAGSVAAARARERKKGADKWALFKFKNSFENPICSELNWLQTLASNALKI